MIFALVVSYLNLPPAGHFSQLVTPWARAAGPDDAESGRRRVGQGAKLLLGQTESVLHPAPHDHLRLEIGHLLAQGRDLVAELLFRAVLIAHRD